MNEQEKLIQNQTDTEKAVEKPLVSSIIPDGIAYYPGFGKHGEKLHPDKKLIPYAEACIEIVRLLNDKAATLYNQVVQICKEPECQAIFAKLATHTVREPYDTLCLLETFQREGLSKSVIEAENSRREGLDYPPSLLKVMGDFVHYGFNRPDDIRNKSPMVVLDRSEPLFVALSTIACYDSIGLSQPLSDRIKSGSVSHLFGCDPSSRPERRRKAKIIASFHRLGFGAVSKQTLLYGAELWYKSRVNPGKLVNVCDDLQLANESMLSLWIEPYDHATGYPR